MHSSYRQSLALMAAAALAAAVTLPLTLATSNAAEAQVRKKAHKPKSVPRSLHRRSARVVYDDSSPWYPNNADQLKIGSRIWWDQMQREGRLGGHGGAVWRR